MEEEEGEQQINIQTVFLTADLDEDDEEDDRPTSPKKYSNKVMTSATKHNMEEETRR